MANPCRLSLDQGPGGARISRVFAVVFLLAAMVATPIAFGQVPLNQRVLVVYNAGVPDSVTVANHYVSQRAIPTANLCPISPASTTTLTWSQYVTSVKTPVQNCLSAVGASNILYIVLTYQTPFTITGTSSPFTFALDSYVADIWDNYSNQDFYPYPTQFQPYYEDAQSQGNLYQPFVPFSGYRAQQSATLIYSVWRLDGASVALANGLVDKAIAAESSGLTGQACLDRRSGPLSGIFDADYGEGEWDLHRAATLATEAGFTVLEDQLPTEFGSPPSPKCPGAALYSGWYSFVYNPKGTFSWNTGAIGWHLDSASATNPRGGINWSANAIIDGITVTTGSVYEPYLQGLVRPGGAYRDLFQGANVGDAFLRNTRWLKWMILYLGDPLYRPFPNGLSPFNPPLPQASLSLSPRYMVNGAVSTATVTLASAAPPGGTVVNLTSGNPKLLPVPSSITVAGGTKTASFTITAASSSYVTGDTSVLITAAGVGQNSLTVSPLLGTPFVAPKTILGGAASTGLVTLNDNAPSGGAVVTLSSSNPKVVVPSTVTVPEGTSRLSFPVASTAVSSATAVTITARLRGAAFTTSLTLEPALVGMSVLPATVVGGAKASVNLTLGAAAPPGGWSVNLASSDPSVASVPSSVTVSAGLNYLQVPVTTSPQCSVSVVSVTASSGLSSFSKSLTVTPPPVSYLGVPTSVKGGQSVTASVSLSYPACALGLPVTLTSSNPSVASVPPTVTVTGGQTSATFTITTSTVSIATPVTISATSDGITKSKVLTVKP